MVERGGCTFFALEDYSAVNTAGFSSAGAIDTPATHLIAITAISHILNDGDPSDINKLLLVVFLCRLFNRPS